MTNDDRSPLERHLAEGRTYFWALRHAHDDPAGARDALADAGLDLAAIEALRELERPIARYPHPTVGRVDRRFLYVPLPGGAHCYFTPILVEHGVECGLELNPVVCDWTFAHREMQFVMGGETPLDVFLLHGEQERKLARVGDVMAIPAGTRLIFNSSEPEGGFAHAHLFLTSLGEAENQVYYDAVTLLRLQQLGIVDPPAGTPVDDLPPLEDVYDRVEVKDWTELATPRLEREFPLPTWLRNGWAAREWTRALDYAEGTRSLVVAAPDRDPADFVPWGEGQGACTVNPLIAEHTCAMTDCVLPPGWFACQPATELWAVLRGSANVSMTLSPLHSETHVREIASGEIAVIPGGSRVRVEDASADLVVRRIVESCARNAHCAMMERKLEADGLHRAVRT